MRTFRCVGSSLLTVSLLAWGGCGLSGEPLASARATVELVKSPNSGIQPRAVLDAAGRLHVVYFSGDPAAGDLFYVYRHPGSDAFSNPVRVNSQPGSAIATGTIRGAQIAIGRANRLHVVWNGSGIARPTGPGGTPMLYARLNDAGAAFEPQRNLITWAGGIDGGGTVAADATGTVYVAWHAAAGARDDAHRSVFVTRSADDGAAFEQEHKASGDRGGACACCGMASAIDSSAGLHLMYRAADDNINRDMFLLSSTDGGRSFRSTTLDQWNVGACPLTTSALLADRLGLLAAWETKQQVFFRSLTRGAMPEGSVVSSGGSGVRRHPAVARNGNGEVLFAWTEGISWAKGGSLGWQVYDASLRPTAVRGNAPGVAAWGLPAAVAQQDHRFILLY